MDDKITIIDHGTGEVVIEVRETIESLWKSKTLHTYIVYPLFLFALVTTSAIVFVHEFLLIFIMTTITIFVVPISLHILFGLFYRKVRISITPAEKRYRQISIKSYFEIANYYDIPLTSQSHTLNYRAGATVEYERLNDKISDSIIKIPSTDNKEIRIWVNTYPETLQRTINKILSSEKFKLVAKSKIKQGVLLDVENDNSLSIIDILNAISNASFRITRINDNHLTFDKKMSYQLSTFWHLFGGTFFVGLGLQGIDLAAFLARILPRTLGSLEIIQLISIILIFFLSTASIFRGVYIIVKRLITAVLRQIVRFDNISQVITLEEHFPIYKSTQKYFWEKAEFSIEKPRNAADYLEDKKVLVLTLQKAGQPAKRVELLKHENQQYLQQLRDYIGEFYREQDISDTIR